ncbi:superoxide dismutase family protein [Clostridium sp.]|uniref:superoxide dismutase family protein n=1 Tax=Clostridium sp. TaxID=1506 RepID=UPI0032174073
MSMIYPKHNIKEVFSTFDYEKADACAIIKGGPLAPDIKGEALLYQLTDGVYIRVYVSGIPNVTSDGNPSAFHGFHIHEFGKCIIDDSNNPFSSAGGHWNPTNCPHPFHAGDLPPLLSANGVAVMCVFTSNFYLEDVIGKSFILHEGPDDFTTQPAGNSGAKLACGLIEHCNY